MKHAAFVLAIVVAAFVVGCQDNSITNPTLETPSSSKAAPINPIARTIRLNAIVYEGFNTFTEITGQVEYTTTSLPRDPVPPSPQFGVVVTLALKAELKPFGSEQPVWRVFNSSRDELSNSDGVMFLEKSYRIEGRDDEVSLHVQFQVTDENVKVLRMWLVPTKLPRSQDGN